MKSINSSNKTILFLSIAIITVLLIPGAISLIEGIPAGSITKTYGPNSDINGWINLSLGGEDTTTEITASFDGVPKKTFTIKTLLDENPSYQHTCNPLNCTDSYSATNGQTTKGYYITSGQEELFGFEINGKVKSIDSVKFNVASDAYPSCKSQVNLDILNNEEIDWINENPHATGLCQPKSYGCFDSNKTATEFSLTPGKQYCQRLNLTQYPGFELGAWIKKVSGSSTIVMSLHDTDGALEESCEITGVESAEGAEYSCAIDYLVSNPEEHLLCMYLSGGDGEYRIKGYPESEGCGYPGEPTSQEETAAYKIFTQGRQFDSIGTIQVANTLPGSSENIATKIWNYLIETYGITNGEIDCSQGCIVPINLLPEMSYASVTINNAEIKYSTNAGQITDTTLYDLSTVPAKVTSDAGRMFLNKLEIKTPEEIKNHTFTIKMGSQLIFSQEIEIKNVPIIQSVTPSEVAATFPTKFTAEVSVPENASVMGYIWYFGGNETITTTINTTTYTYPTNGSYNLDITVLDDRGLSSTKSFTIEVTSPDSLINSTLDKFSKDLASIKEDISTQKASSQQILNTVLGINEVTEEISDLKSKYNQAETSEDYSDIVSRILAIEIPEKIILTSQAEDITLFADERSVDPEAVKEITGGSLAADESKYQEAIAAWQQEYVDIELNFEEFSAEYTDSIRSITGIINIEVKNKKDVAHDYYLIIPKQNLEFTSLVAEEGNYAYINLQDTSKISFYTTERINIEDLQAFVSPPINRLSVQGHSSPAEGTISRRAVLIISIIALIIATIVAYILLQQWYKNKYEKHLFPNRNDLYNIMHYINNAEKKNHTHKDMEKKLHKAGWHHEQIRYALKKFKGKRTGMIELPLPKSIKNPKKKHHRHHK